jgi:hypothetical protein
VAFSSRNNHLAGPSLGHYYLDSAPKVISSAKRESGWIERVVPPTHGAIEIRKGIIGIIRACPYMAV